ncbi:MAG: hypothetical protein M3552_00085 [Planctomycetota bacterium]|nr:hypothetical protein [Planctomycetota bacterium]
MGRLVAFGIGVSLIVGCADDEPVSATVKASPSVGSDSEASWQTQIAAARNGRSDSIRVTLSNVTSQEFRELGDGCDGLTTLVIERGSIANADLTALSRLPKLRWLKLPVTVDDAGVELIAACRQIQILNLPNAKFSDRACLRLADLDRLTLLRFGSPNVTDRGLESLAKLPRLRFLHLLEVSITDSGLGHIGSIETLESFYLDGGRTTDDGLSRLLTRRPDLHFHLNETHLPGDPNAHHEESSAP